MDAKLVTVTDVLHHFLLSLAFRFRHVTADAPEGFGDFAAGADVRTPCELVRHMTGLIAFVHGQFSGSPAERPEPLDWEGEKRRFTATLRALDEALADTLPPSSALRLEQVWQGQMIDAMTHIGQLATLRRLAGAPVAPVRYWQVELPPLEREPR